MDAIKRFLATVSLAVLLSSPSWAGAVAPVKVEAVEASHSVGSVVNALHEALTMPPMTANLDQSLRLKSSGKEVSIVPVTTLATPLLPQVDHDKVSAYLLRAQALAHPFITLPKSSMDTMMDWEDCQLASEMPAVQPMPEALPATAVVVRGKPSAAAVSSAIKDFGGKKDAMQALLAAQEVLKRFEARDLGRMSMEDLNAVSEEIDAKLRGLKRGSWHSSWRSEKEDSLAELESRRAIDDFNFPFKKWAPLLKGYVAEANGRPLAYYLQKASGLTPAEFKALAEAKKKALVSKAMATAKSAIEADVNRDLKAASRPAMELSELESAAESLRFTLEDVAKTHYLSASTLAQAHQTYDELQALIQANRHRENLQAFKEAAGSQGLDAVTYADHLGAVAMVPAPRQAGANVLPTSSQDWLRKYSDSMSGHMEERLRRDWSAFYLSWRQASRFGTPAVSDPRALFEDLLTLGRTGKVESLGLLGYSHPQIHEDGLAAFQKHFASVKDAQALQAMRGLIARAIEYLPGHVPFKAARLVAFHLSRAAMLPAGEVTDYLHHALPLDDQYYFRKFSQTKQKAMLAAFVKAARQTLQEESALAAPQSKVLGMVLTGSFALMSAGPSSDFDVQLVTADGSAQAVKAFSERLKAKCQSLGITNPIGVYPIPLGPSPELINKVHGLHLLITEEPALLGQGALSLRLQTGIYSSPSARDDKPLEQDRALARSVMAKADLEHGEDLPPAARAVGYFAGMQRWADYLASGRSLWDKGYPEVTELYERAGKVLGVPAESLLFEKANFPAELSARSAHIAASFILHQLALDIHLKKLAAAQRIPVRLDVYSGDSLGMLSAAIAAGSLSLEDGLRLARFILPSLHQSQQRAGEEFLVLNVKYYFDSDALPKFLRQVAERFDGRVDVSRHYSNFEMSLNVPAKLKGEFAAFMKERFPHAEVSVKAGPTTRVYHSGALKPTRQALESFLRESGIRFQAPKTRLVSSATGRVAATGDDVRQSILGLVDEPIHSAEALDAIRNFDPDIIVGLGLAEKQQNLFDENHVEGQVLYFTGAPKDEPALFQRLTRPTPYTRGLRSGD